MDTPKDDSNLDKYTKEKVEKGIQDLLETYDEDFAGDEARKSWDSVLITGRESLAKLIFA